MKTKIAFSLLLALALSTGPVAVFAQQTSDKTDKGQSAAEKTDKAQTLREAAGLAERSGAAV